MKFIYLFIAMTIMATNQANADVYGVKTLEAKGTSYVKVTQTGESNSKVMFSYCADKNSTCEPIGQGEYNIQDIDRLRSELTSLARVKRAGKWATVLTGSALTALIVVSIVFPPAAPAAGGVAGAMIVGFLDGIGMIIVGASSFVTGAIGINLVWNANDLPSGSEFYQTRDLIKEGVLSEGDTVVPEMTTEDYAEQLALILDKIDAGQQVLLN